jgi:ATP-binding cassette, subfamily B, multidrug efflux pump
MSKTRSKSRFPTFLNYIRPHWKTAIGGILALFLVNGLNVLIPLMIRYTLNQRSANSQSTSFLQPLLDWVGSISSQGRQAVGNGLSLNNVGAIALLILVLTTLMWFVRMASRTWLFGVGRQVEFDLKQRIFNHLLRLEPAYFAINTPGDLISRATSDVENIRRVMGFSLLSTANMVFAYAMTLPLMLNIDGWLTAVSLAVYPLILVLVQLFSNYLRDQQQAVQESTATLSDLIQEDMSGMALIKIYAQEDNERQAFRRLNHDLLKANLNLAKTQNTLFPVLRGLANLSQLALLALGIGKIVDQTLDVGDFVALLLYAQNLVFPTALLGFTITAYQRGEVSLDRLEAILQTRSQIRDTSTAIALPLSQVKGSLRAQHLSFTYPGANTPALSDINFTIAPGETVAIVGPIGSGKSTLANVLPRLVELQPGQVFLDGLDTLEIQLTDLRRAIAYVPQESFLFSTTIKNNIRYGDPEDSQAQVELAAKQAQMHSEVLNFPQQYQTIVGERGITLSGGQRQRTALARALLVDAPVLILDDALSSVDNQTATDILRNLSEGTRRKTVIFISHQLSATAIADRILVMDKGRIVQEGTHGSLLEQPGLYRSLWEKHTLEQAA